MLQLRKPPEAGEEEICYPAAAVAAETSSAQRQVAVAAVVDSSSQDWRQPQRRAEPLLSLSELERETYPLQVAVEEQT